MKSFSSLLSRQVMLVLLLACATPSIRHVEVTRAGSIPPEAPADVLSELNALQPNTEVILDSPESKFSDFEDGKQFTYSSGHGLHCIRNLIYGWTKCFKYSPGRMRTDDNNDKYVVVLYGASFDESFVRSAYYPQLIVLDFKTGQELGVVKRPGRRPARDDTWYLEPIAVRGNKLYYQIGPCCRQSSPSERTTDVIEVPNPK